MLQQSAAFHAAGAAYPSDDIRCAVKPRTSGHGNDFVDAEVISEAASHSLMRFVQPRTESQQAMRALHRVRESLVQDKVKTTCHERCNSGSSATWVEENG